MTRTPTQNLPWNAISIADVGVQTAYAEGWRDNRYRLPVPDEIQRQRRFDPPMTAGKLVTSALVVAGLVGLVVELGKSYTPAQNTPQPNTTYESSVQDYGVRK